MVNQIREESRDLVRMMRQVGSQLAADQDQEQTAAVLGQIADQLDRILGAPPEDQFRFLMQLLQTTVETNGDPQAVYGVMREGLDLLDERMIGLGENKLELRWMRISLGGAGQLLGTLVI